MAFRDTSDQRATSIRDEVRLPRRQQYVSSPRSWQDEVLYFVLVDRFSDGREDPRPLLDRTNRSAARPGVGGAAWQWEPWWRSGRDHWQGGTLRGAMSKLGYLEDLGVTAIWLSPVFKQRVHRDTFHGYGIQDLLDVDPRFGTRRELVDLVGAAHDRRMRVILDVIFNHSGANWLYPGGELMLPYTTGHYEFGSWLGRDGGQIAAIGGADDGAWPIEIQDPDAYTRAGSANLAEDTDVADVLAEHKRGDFVDLRDFNLGRAGLLADLSRCYQYWIALTGCDGFRIDTVKHVSLADARNFCESIKEYAINLGINEFFLLAEVAGGDNNAARYVEAAGRNLNAVLDIGDARTSLTDVAKGLAAPRAYFDQFERRDELGSHRVLGDRHVSILDDHDHVAGDKVRFSSGASPEDRQVVVGVAVQLFTLGIPCVYYGTEQAFAGPEISESKWLDGWRCHDEYLREAMFGPDHPRAKGAAGAAGAVDETRPGFGPFGTSGSHCFDRTSPAFMRIALLIQARQAHTVLRHGRQYEREVRHDGSEFHRAEAGEAVAWSRILDVEEAVCVANAHNARIADVDVTVDAALNGRKNATFTVVASTATLSGSGPAVGDEIPVAWQGGRAYVPLRGIPPCEVVILINLPEPDEGLVGRVD